MTRSRPATSGTVRCHFGRGAKEDWQVGFRIVNDSIDAWTLSAFGAMPADVAARLDTLKQHATRAQRDAETPWAYAGEPLRIEQAGMRRRGGKAWNWVLYNRFLRADLCDDDGEDLI